MRGRERRRGKREREGGKKRVRGRVGARERGGEREGKRESSRSLYIYMQCISIFVPAYPHGLAATWDHRWMNSIESMISMCIERKIFEIVYPTNFK